MKKLIALLITLILLVSASPVYAQEDTGYPVETPEFNPEFLEPCEEGCWWCSPEYCEAWYHDYPDVYCQFHDDCVGGVAPWLVGSDRSTESQAVTNAQPGTQSEPQAQPDYKAGGDGPDWDDVVSLALSAVFLIVMIYGNEIIDLLKRK